MTDPRWQRLFVVDGRVRTLWRLLLFVVLFLAFLTAGGVLLELTPLEDWSGSLLWQGALGLLAALAAGWILLAWLDDRPPGALGFAWSAQVPRELGWGVAIGGGSLAVVVAVLALLGWVAYEPERGTLAGFLAVLGWELVVLAVAAAAEEAMFRGYGFQVLVQGLGPVAATVLASAAFAVAHASNPGVGPIALLNIFLAGVLLSAAYLRTRSLWFATAVHLGWNWAMASIFDLPVSGLEFFDTPLYEPIVTGPAWVTGGAFGPEGGLGAGVAFLLALTAVAKLPGLGEAEEVRALRPLVDERMG